MDGKQLLYNLRQLLNESSGSGFLDDYTSYYFLYEAAKEFVKLTKCLRSSTTITTVAGQTDYVLPADFMELYQRNDSGKFFLKYTESSNVHFLQHLDYEDISFRNNTTSVSVPNNFSILDNAMLDRVSGTTTSAGTSSGGEATLTDTAGDFSDVEAGDIVHNTTDGSDGMVLSKTSSTVLVTALFGGTANDYTSGDAYVTQPQGRLKLILDPPPSTAGHTISVPYVQRPLPVFSNYGIYRFQPQYSEAIVKYAAWLYTYRDDSPKFGDAFYQYWDRQVRSAASALNSSFNRRKIQVNLKAR